MRGEDLLEQGRTRARHADDEDGFAAEVGIPRFRQRFRRREHGIDEAFERVAVPRRAFSQACIRVRQRGEGGVDVSLRVLAGAERIEHGDAVFLADVAARELRTDRRAILVRKRPALDVRQPAPRIAAGGMEAQRGAIRRRGFVEAAEVQQRVAGEDVRGQEPWRQRAATLQCVQRGFAFAGQLQVAAEVEPGHRLPGREFAGAAPAGEGAIAIAVRHQRGAEVGVQQRIARMRGNRFAQQRHRIPRALPAQAQDRGHARHFRMPRELRAQRGQQAFGFIEAAVADRARRSLQARHRFRREAGHARIVHGHSALLREARAQARQAGGEHDRNRQRDRSERERTFRRPRPRHHHRVREPGEGEHAGPERGGTAPGRDRQREQHRRQREHQHRGDRMRVADEPQGVEHGQQD
jgi:hypothetical protein